MSVDSRYHASVVLDGKIYVMGGYEGDIDDNGDDIIHDAGDGDLDMVEAYDPQADSWQRVASMPRGLCYHAAAAMGGKIYVTGGMGGQEEDDDDNDNDNVFLNLVYVYDPQADAWTRLASMSFTRATHASAAVGGKLYVFGGHVEGGHLSTAEVYDPASDSWAQGSSLAFAREGLVAVAL